jgi:hypothetical protein
MAKYRSMTSTVCAILVLVVLALASCGRESPAVIAPTGTAIGSTVTATGSSVTSSATGCGQLPGFATAHWVDIPYTDLPQASVLVASITSNQSEPLEVVSYEVCVPAPGTPPPVGTVLVPTPTGKDATSQVVALLNLRGRGWIQSGTFPLDGSSQAPCASNQLCYTLSFSSYLLVQHIMQYRQHLLTFEVLLAQTQPLVLCDPNEFAFPAPSASATTISPSANAQIPIPPLTALTQTASGNGFTITIHLCSAGTAKSVTDFMMSKMPNYGWKLTTNGSPQVWSQTASDGYQFLVRIPPIVDPKNWSLTEN